MTGSRSQRHCRLCGGGLAADNRAVVCSPCVRRLAVADQAPQLPDEFWEHPELQAAFKLQRFGAVIRAYRRVLGGAVTQARIGGWLELSQEQVSRIERYRSAAKDLQKLNRWAQVLGIPQRYLWFALSDSTSDACTEQEAGSSLAAISPLAVSVAAGRAEDGTSVDRRDAIRVLATGTVTGLGAVLVKDSPWQRLVDSLERKRPADPATVRLLEDRTADFFRAEETTPARQLLLSLRQHREDSRTLAVNTDNAHLKRRLITSAGETDALTGWLLFDLQRFSEAIQVWQRAADTARNVGDQPLLACVLGYWSYLLTDQDNHVGALDLLRDAASQVRGCAAATQSWIAARQAEEAAALRNSDDALHALDQAMTLFDYASPRTERVWTAFFSASRLGSMTVRAYSQLNHPQTDTMARSLLSSLLPTETKVRAIVLADLARSTAVHGDFDRAGSLANEAAPLAVRTETSLATDRLWTLVEILPQRGTIAVMRQQLIDQLSAPASRS